MNRITAIQIVDFHQKHHYGFGSSSKQGRAYQLRATIQQPICSSLNAKSLCLYLQCSDALSEGHCSKNPGLRCNGSCVNFFTHVCDHMFHGSLAAPAFKQKWNGVYWQTGRLSEKCWKSARPKCYNRKLNTWNVKRKLRLTLQLANGSLHFSTL